MAINSYCLDYMIKVLKMVRGALIETFKLLIDVDKIDFQTFFKHSLLVS